MGAYKAPYGSMRDPFEELNMFDRFTDRARKVMALARKEAHRFNHDFIGTEHILLGLVQEGSGVAANVLKNLDVDDKQLDRLEGIVNSMTSKEREDTAVLTKSRTKRIATGAGVPTTEVNRLVKQFGAMQKMTKQMAGMGSMGKMKAMREMQQAGAGSMMPGGGMPNLGARGSTKTKSVKSGFKRRKRR